MVPITLFKELWKWKKKRLQTGSMLKLCGKSGVSKAGDKKNQEKIWTYGIARKFLLSKNSGDT